MYIKGVRTVFINYNKYTIQHVSSFFFCACCSLCCLFSASFFSIKYSEYLVFACVLRFCICFGPQSFCYSAENGRKSEWQHAQSNTSQQKKRQMPFAVHKHTNNKQKWRKTIRFGSFFSSSSSFLFLSFRLLISLLHFHAQFFWFILLLYVCIFTDLDIR